MIEKMTKYSFILLSGKTEEFLSKIQSLGLVDISRSEKPVDEVSLSIFNESESLTKAINGLQALDFRKDADFPCIEAAVDTDAVVEDPLKSWKEESAKLESLKKELNTAENVCKNISVWGEFDKNVLADLESRGYKTRFYCVPKKVFNPEWANDYALQIASEGKSTISFITISDDKDYSLPVEECAAPECDFKEASARVDKLKDAIIVCKATLWSLKEYVPELTKRQGKDATDLQFHLAQVGGEKAAEDTLTTFEGFAPTSEDENLCSVFDKLDVVYLKEEAVSEDNPPIEYKGNRFTKMFTVITDMYGRPGYDEFDPTPFISIFFTLFFAMCMGDAGYGIILVLVGLALKKVKSDMGSYAPLVMTLGVTTFIVGLVMHTFFGIDLAMAAWVPDWMHKFMITGTIAGYDAQMALSVLIGIFHVSLAMVIKMIYSIKRNGFVKSIETISWTLLIVGGVIIGGAALLGVMDKAVTKWVVIVVGAISAVGIFLLNDVHRNPLINIGAGLYATYNTATGLLGDVLSYMRLYALGLAGGMLGNAFNMLGSSVLGADIPVVNILGGVVIIIFGHVLNVAMCALGAFVHPLRLTFLEFFKNSGYEGSGRTYSPLANKEQLTDKQ